MMTITGLRAGFSWSQVEAFSQWIRPQSGLMFNKGMIYNGIQGQSADTPQRLDNPDQLGIDCDTSLPLHSFSPCRTWGERVLERAAWRHSAHEMQANQELVLLYVFVKSVSSEEKSQQEFNTMEFWNWKEVTAYRKIISSSLYFVFGGWVHRRASFNIYHQRFSSIV